MRSRWSPSIFDPGHRLTAEQIRSLLQAVRWAPSRGNLQPWAVVVAERDAPAHRALVTQLRRGNAGWVPRASAVFVMLAQVGPTPEQEDDPPPLDHALHDLGQAAAHLTLQARALDLHAHQFSGLDADALAQALGVPPYFRVVSGIAVGVRGNPDDAPERDRQRERRERRRRPLTEWAFADSWGTPWQSDEEYDD